jgi:hypothetical protein
MGAGVAVRTGIGDGGDGVAVSVGAVGAVGADSAAGCADRTWLAQPLKASAIRARMSTTTILFFTAKFSEASVLENLCG